MKKNGFQSGPQSTLNSDYVKEQRAEVVKKHHDQVLAIKKEIAVLENKKASIEADLAVAFKDRLALVESRESAIKTSDKELTDKTIATNSAKEVLERAQAEFETSTENRLNEIRAETRKNESLLSALSEQKAAFEAIEQKNKESEVVLAAREKDLQSQESLLAHREADIESEIGKLQAIKSSIDPTLAEINSKRQALSVQQQSVNADINFLNGLLEAVKNEKALNESILSELKTEKQNASKAVKENLDILRDIKSREVLIKENENKVKVWEQSSKADISNKTRELDEREARIKKLEAQVGEK